MLFRKSKRPGSGCAYVVIVGAVVIALFVFNMLLVRSIGVAIPVLEDQRVRQFVELVLPVGLIFAEFWLYDFLTDMLDRRIT